MAWLSSGLGFESGVGNSPQKVSICHLSSHLMNTLIVGTVIAKQDLRSFPNRKKPGTERYVLNFTIRDSPSDAINASCWGEEDAVKNMYNSFQIGSVVQIKNAQIQTRQTDGSDERYRPKVNSLYHLNISTVHSEVKLYDGSNTRYSSLLHYPLNSENGYCTLSDIIHSGCNVDEQQINLLVAVRRVSAPQEINTKDGRHIRKLELKVFDQTHPMFSIFIWDEATLTLSQQLVPGKSVLFISDVRVTYNRYSKEIEATANSCTTFTPDPEIPDACILQQYALTANLDMEDSEFNLMGHSEQGSTTIYTVDQICKLCLSAESCDIEGIVFAFLSKLDLDGYSKLTSIRCQICKQLQTQPGQCKNTNCAAGVGFEVNSPKEQFDFNIWLTDHTGTMKRCLLSGSVAEKLLNCTTEEFLRMNEYQKTTLKWKYLFEKFKVKFKVMHSPVTGNPVVRLLSLRIAAPDEVASNIDVINMIFEE